MSVSTSKSDLPFSPDDAHVSERESARARAPFSPDDAYMSEHS